MKANHKLPMLLSLLLLATSVQQASAFYNPQTGRWLNRDPIGEHVFLDRLVQQRPDMEQSDYDKVLAESRKPSYLAGLNDFGNHLDVLGMATTTVPSCKIVIWLGHNNTVPQGTIQNAICSASAVVSCGPTKTAKPAVPTSQIPGTQQTPPGVRYTILEGERIAHSFFKKGVAHARALCEGAPCGCVCKKIVVRLECDFGFDVLGRMSLRSDTCGKEETIECGQ